jgi:hypothetical protein
MEARKKVHRANPGRNTRLRKKIEHFAFRKKDRDAMLKDIHLIEAAMAADHIIASLDESARGLFVSMSKKIGEVGNILWVNPGKDGETPVLWLQYKAKREKKRLLGFKEKVKK